MKEVQIKEEDLKRKARKDELDAQFKERQQQLEESRLQQSAADKVMTAQKDREQMTAEMSLDVLKHLSSQHQETEMARTARENQPRKPTKGE
jgi:hypothetical protein